VTILACGAAVGLAGSACRADLDSLTSLSLRKPPAPETPAAPADAAPLPDRFSPDWTLQIEPTVWFVGPSGKFKLPVNSGTGPGGFTTEGDKIRVNDVDLDSTRLRPAGTLTLASGKWRFAFWGSEYELGRSSTTVDFAGRLGAVAFAPGDQLKLDLSLGTYELSAGYRIWDYDFAENTKLKNVAVDAQLTIHLLGGARLYDLEIGAENLSSPGRAEGSHVFAEPMVGVRAETIIDTDFSVILQLTAGGLPLYSTSSYSLDVVAAFQWRPTRNIGLQIGWRQLAFDLSDGKDLDEFEYSGRLAGLFAGVVIRF
jgi:hypothetical protein